MEWVEKGAIKRETLRSRRDAANEAKMVPD
jgi:hypothetical protein